MTRLLIWYGEVTSPGRLRRRGAALLLGGVAWLLAFLLIPSLVLVVVAFAQRGAFGQIQWEFSVENFRRVAGYTSFGWSPDFLTILGRSLWVALVTTVACVLLAYPLAFFIAGRPPRTRYLLLGLVIIPFCTNMVVRTYAWMLLLGASSPLTAAARALGLIAPQAALYPSAFAVYVGMITMFLPFTVLPLYTSVERLDWTIVEAARDLYASRWRVFTQAILPQTLPGLSAALILTFIPAIGVFVVPDLLGGAKVMLVGNLIQQQFGPSQNIPLGAALSLGLMVLTLAGLFALRRSGGKVELG